MPADEPTATAARRFVQTDSPTPGDGYFCTCGSTDGDCLRCYLASWHYKRACTVGAT